MRVSTLHKNLRQRLRQGATWVGILGYGTFFSLVPMLFGGWKALTLSNLVAAYWLSLCYGLFSPLPWLWTGDDRLWTGYGRGLIQALVANIGLVALSLLPLLPNRGFYAVRGLWPYLPMHLMGLMLVGYFIALGIRTETKHDASVHEAKQARFQLLQAQLSPHFLFNALSAFAELGRRDWPATEQGLLDLARVYRGLLELGERAESTLGEERALLEAMLSVESLRFGPRLRVSWDWEEGVEDRILPPLLLLPLVENALKHGLAPSETGGALRIAAHRQGSGLRLEVANTGAWGVGAPGTGTGLKNLEARLRLGFGPEATFSLEREGEWTTARIVVP